MYYIINIDKFVVMRGPFTEFSTAFKVLRELRINHPQSYIVQAVDVEVK